MLAKLDTNEVIKLIFSDYVFTFEIYWPRKYLVSAATH